MSGDRLSSVVFPMNPKEQTRKPCYGAVTADGVNLLYVKNGGCINRKWEKWKTMKP
jgi:hypothetical protein